MRAFLVGTVGDTLGVDQEATVTLWRPTGPEELALVEASGWTAWPTRLPEQPIFYSILNEDYATRIARDWNVKASGVGYVTRFQVRKSFPDRDEVHQAGGRAILEYWVPAEDLDDLNKNIVWKSRLLLSITDRDMRGCFATSDRELGRGYQETASTVPRRRPRPCRR
jgi:hypothetical protein